MKPMSRLDGITNKEKPMDNQQAKNVTRNNMPGAFWRVSKPLLHLAIDKGYDGCHCALYFEDLLQQEKWVETYLPKVFRVERGAFFLQQKDSAKRTGLSPHYQRQAIDFLISERLITVQRRHTPPKNYFTINHTRFLEICAMTPPIEDDYTQEVIGEDGYPIIPEKGQTSTPLIFKDEPRQSILSKDNTDKEYNLRDSKKQESLKGELKLSQQERSTPPKDLSEDTRSLVEHWNACCTAKDLLLQPHVHRITPGSKLLQRVDAYIKKLQAGTFVSSCKELTPDWCAANKVNHAWRNKTWSLKEIKAAVTSYFNLFRKEYWPLEREGKKSLPKSLDDFFYTPEAPARKSYLLHVSCTPPTPREGLLDPEVLDVLVESYTKIAHKPDAAERRTLEEAANGIVHWHRKMHKGVAPLCDLGFANAYKRPAQVAYKLQQFLSYLYNNDRSDMPCYPGMYKPGSKTWTAFLHFCEDEFHIPVNVDWDAPEDWAWKYTENAVRGFARRVEKVGLESARLQCGDRIPYYTIEQCDQRKADWTAKHGNAQWGRGIIREVLKGKK